MAKEPSRRHQQKPHHPPMPTFKLWEGLLNTLLQGLAIMGVAWWAGRTPNRENAIVCNGPNISLAVGANALFNQSYPTVQALCDDEHGTVMHSLYREHFTPVFKNFCITPSKNGTELHLYAHADGHVADQFCDFYRTVDCAPRRKRR